MTIDDHVKRDFYSWMCMVKNWNARRLRTEIDKELFENTPGACLHEDERDSEWSLEQLESELMRALVSRDDTVLRHLGIDE